MFTSSATSVAWSFGVNIADQMTWSVTNSFASSNSSMLVAGWWHPTTLTATRRLWSCGNNIGAQINTTTSELRLKTDNTTDKEWTTSGVGLALNQWKFLAFLGSFTNTGAAAQWRVWSGTIDVAPIEATVSVAVAGAGNFTGATSFALGNGAAGPLGWQGLIGSVMTVYATQGSQSVLPVSSGVINNEEADIVFKSIVLPVWLGDWFPPRVLQNNSGFAQAFETMHIGMEHNTSGGIGIQAIRRGSSSVSPFVGGSQAANVILSQTSTPRPMRQPKNDFLRRR